jgi:hypothetical protein
VGSSVVRGTPQELDGAPSVEQTAGGTFFGTLVWCAVDADSQEARLSG